MSRYVLAFTEINSSNLPDVGGKGANLGELSKIKVLKVPKGFCITTAAYRKALGDNEELSTLLDELMLLRATDNIEISAISKKIRDVIEASILPVEVENEITEYVTSIGVNTPYAVRSSATAEDLPTASFAGLQDTYLNIIGISSILEHVKKCWASLYTDRAIIYRTQNSFDHRKVYLSVVIQKMIFPEASGIMFTADPVSSNRRVISIDASFGLGEALVSGLVNADIYKVREGNIIDKKISSKKLAIYSLPKGGTEERELSKEFQDTQTLSDNQILELEAMGRQIENYFGRPQDIEWCLFEGSFYIVQSRPITTLYPIPENDGNNHIYASMGHLQMMTDDIKPLGISFIQMLSFWFGQSLVPAGGRLFLDATYDLGSPIIRKVLITSIGKADVLMKNAIENVIARKDFMKALPKGKSSMKATVGALGWIVPALKVYRKKDIKIVKDIISYNEGLIEELEKKIVNYTGEELLDFIIKDTTDLKGILTGPQNMSLMAVGGLVYSWLDKKLEKWLGEKNAVDTLSKSVLNNVTSEMGLALLDIAAEVRNYPEIINYFSKAEDSSFFHELIKLEGGKSAAKTLYSFLDKYGMRCPGEIDITKPRWVEKPTALIPFIISNIKSFEVNSTEKFEQGRREAEERAAELLRRIEELPGGKQKAKKTRAMISRLRNVIGFREYPKYSFIKRFYIYKKALLIEASKLVELGVLKEREDIYFLYLQELRDVIRTKHVDYSLIIKRKEEYALYSKLTPPRIMTSEGEIISGAYKSDKIPAGALAGVPVSSGIIEGRARVVTKVEDAKLEDGDILVTVFTDPSWTPLFVTVKGLVTEVGGLMTHGAVITREYGIPGVVGVENATRLIKDGARIRVNGTEGYVEILD